jgi:hypothetical protein
MRHFIAKARPVTPAALGVLEATRVARCITPARGLLGEAPGFSGAPPRHSSAGRGHSSGR